MVLYKQVDASMEQHDECQVPLAGLERLARQVCCTSVLAVANVS